MTKNISNLATLGLSTGRMAGRKVKLCKEKGCQNAASTVGYCRIHYLKNWKTLKAKEKQKAVQTLNKYIDHVMRKNPEGYMEEIRDDLKNQDVMNQKVDKFFDGDGFHDVLDEVGSDDVERIIDGIKIDDSF
jgi:hypothetical protein